MASAEFAAGAALQAQSGWVPPAVFSVLVFTGVVAITMLLARPSVDVTSPPSTLDLSGGRTVPEPPLALAHAVPERAGQLLTVPQS